MADPITIMMIGSTVLSASGGMQEGEAANEASKRDAAQLRDNANAAQARGTREAAEEARIKRKNISDAEAQMAGMGGITTDAGAVETLAKIEEVGEYNALSALYDADVEASGLRSQARVVRAKGRAAVSASRTKALSTIIQGGTQAYGSYKAGQQPAYKDLPRNRKIGAGGKLPGESFDTRIKY